MNDIRAQFNTSLIELANEWWDGNLYGDAPERPEILLRLSNKANIVILKKLVLYFNDLKSLHKAVWY